MALKKAKPSPPYIKQADKAAGYAKKKAAQAKAAKAKAAARQKGIKARKGY